MISGTNDGETTTPGNKPSNPEKPTITSDLDDCFQDYDYFVLSNTDTNVMSNRITIPYTNNQEIIKKYGNAPLSWKLDFEITEQDIMNMFLYLCLYAKSICVSFGERRINTNLFNSAFVKWCSQYHKYFPYKCFDNPPPVFTSKSMDGKYTFPGSIDGRKVLTTI